MITYTITGDNIPNSDAVRDYVNSHFNKFEKFVDANANHDMYITLSKTTAHQREDTYHAEIKFKVNSDNYVVGVAKADIFVALDEAKDILMMKITKNHDKKKTFFHRGARKIKSLFRK
jgi:ribosomal subunit interface protein